MKKVLFIATIVLFSLASCDKDDDCSTNVNSVSGTYKVTAAKYKQSSGAQEEDWYVLMPPCEKDDLQILNANGTYEYQDAGTTCGGGYTGDWSLSGNTITIDGEVGTIESFNCKTLVVSGEFGLVAGDKLTVTYAKQ